MDGIPHPEHLNAEPQQGGDGLQVARLETRTKNRIKEGNDG
jgi:hypothetical protein